MISEVAAGPLTVASRVDAEGYVAKVCFKTGPPRLLGVELEWTVHHAEAPDRALDAATLSTALGEHAPRTLRPDSPHIPLPHGGMITVEPGGQVELSTPPWESIADLLTKTSADIDRLITLLSEAGLRMGTEGCDRHRPARRILDTSRYAAMERAFDRLGPHGRNMMCGTAGLQVCLDAGTRDRVGARWAALHALGPILLATFANSRHHAGRDSGWASNRMRTWFDTDPARTHPPVVGADPAAAWSRWALDTPLLCVRRPGGRWNVPRGVTFADWINGALPHPPSYDDLDYHLSTLFPPVRARGYLEVRYLDAQAGDGWLAPVAVLAALFAREETVDEAAALAAPAAGRWMPAARDGLADPVLAAVAPGVLGLAHRALADLNLPAAITTVVTDSVHRRLDRGGFRD